MNKTICYKDAAGKIHAWQHAKHWTDEYLSDMLEHLAKCWPSFNYYLGDIPPEKCCQLHGAK